MFRYLKFTQFRNSANRNLPPRLWYFRGVAEIQAATARFDKFDILHDISNSSRPENKESQVQRFTSLKVPKFNRARMGDNRNPLVFDETDS